MCYISHRCELTSDFCTRPALLPQIAKLMPGIIVLSSFPPLPWGQLAPGPKPAFLIALSGIVDESVLQDIVDKVCRLHTASPPMLLRIPPVVSVGAAGAGGSAAAATPSGAAGKALPKPTRTEAQFSAADIAGAAVLPAMGAMKNVDVGSLRPAVECAVASLIM